MSQDIPLILNQSPVIIYLILLRISNINVLQSQKTRKGIPGVAIFRSQNLFKEAIIYFQIQNTQIDAM